DPRRADERGGRAHRGPHRRPRRGRAARPYHADLHHEPARARPRRPRDLRRGRPGAVRGAAPGAARPRRAVRGHGDPWGGTMTSRTILPVADEAQVRAYARRLILRYPWDFGL